ncbi:hypothetical protein NQ318_005411 [Aromia moschata]|uniref:RZZ complex subunit KNTC1/ROD C-terminal domain-containing protein n=1 Tax=Aromia moschata TaxID=1265417 RepID=A0AAV8YW26_9CUCU|nr:hypothetical protein NQ318_005411 [Aromia moschata]
MTDVSYNEFLDYVDKMSLLSELECLGVTLTIEALDQYNKKELLKRLSQIGKLTAVKVMATICMTYIIDDLRYWEFIVNSMLKLGVLTELKVYLDYLKNKCYKGFYVNAWQAVIDDAFNLPLALSEGELYEAYVNNFLMIQSCPVLYSLNFEKILQKCIKTEKFEFAAVLLHYLPETKRDLYVREIVRSRTLSLDLDNLSKRGCGALDG